MTNVSPLSLGGAAGANSDAFTGAVATDKALFLRVFGGEVLTAFEQANVVAPRIMNRSISYGKSATYPIHGRAAARSHAPGEDILNSANTQAIYDDVDQTGGANQGSPAAWAAEAAGKYLSTLGSEQKQIFINDLTIASVFIDDLDETMAHYDLRSAYTSELGKALSRRVDNMAVRALVAAAKATATGPMRGGQSVTDANMNSQADALADSIIEGAQKLDQYDVPSDERFVVLNPAGYYLLLRAAGGIGTTDSYAALLSKDYSLGNGDFAQGRVLMIAGVPVVMSNNTGFGTNFSTAEDGVNTTSLQINMTNTFGVVAHKSAAGMVKLKDLQLESEYMIQNQGNLFVAKLACGIDALRTDAAVELKLA